MGTYLKDKEVTVKKRHRCCWCNEWIEVNDKARYRVYVFDGFQQDYLHPECYEALGESSKEIDEDGFTQGMFERGKTIMECDV